MKTRWIWICGIPAVIVLVVFLLVRNWMDTGYGKLNPKVAIALKLINPTFGGTGNLSVDERREEMNSLSAVLTGKQVPVESVLNRTLPGQNSEIPIRIYHPDTLRTLPIIVFYHGGGWVLGNLDTHDNLVRYLAVKTEAVIVSVDYRLAPEHPFPSGIDDAYAALNWIAENAATFGGDPTKIAVAGDSAGGNLSAVVSLMARDMSGPEISRQVLFYPATNLQTFDTDSYNHFAEGYMLTRPTMIWFRTQYLPDESDWNNPYVSPLLAENHGNLPPATIITGEMDPLRDDGRLYAEKLDKAGVAVHYHCFDGMVHGFASGDKLLSQAREALDEAVQDLRDSFSLN